MTSSTTRVLTDLLRANGATLGLFWAMLYALFATIGVIVSATVGLNESVWVGSRWWPQFFVLAMGIMVVSTQLRIYLANGILRRDFVLGGIGYGLVVAVVCGAGTQLGFVVERAFLNAAGATPFTGPIDFAASPLRIASAALEFTGMYAAYFFGGLLIAAVFQRAGAVWGIASIVPALLPAAAVETALWNIGPLPGLADALAADPAPIVLAAAVVLVALVILTGRRLLRDVAVPSK